MKKEDQKLLEVVICGYLPYGLKILRPDGKTVLELRGVLGNLMQFQEEENPNETFGSIKALTNKPLLHPIECLTKPITVEGYNDGKEFMPIEELAKVHLDWSNLDSNLKVKTHGPLERQFNLEITWDHPSGSKPFFNDNLFLFTKHPNRNQQWIIELFNQWHIDWRGLIPKGLAVAITT